MGFISSRIVHRKLTFRYTDPLCLLQEDMTHGTNRKAAVLRNVYIKQTCSRLILQVITTGISSFVRAAKEQVKHSSQSTDVKLQTSPRQSQASRSINLGLPWLCLTNQRFFVKIHKAMSLARLMRPIKLEVTTVAVLCHFDFTECGQMLKVVGYQPSEVV